MLFLFLIYLFPLGAIIFYHMAIKALPTDKTITGGDMVVLFNDFYFQLSRLPALDLNMINILLNEELFYYFQTFQPAVFLKYPSANPFKRYRYCSCAIKSLCHLYTFVALKISLLNNLMFCAQQSVWDCGEYYCYPSDIIGSFPTNNKFNPHQRTI